MLVSRREVIYSHQIFYIFSFAFENLNYFLMDIILMVPIKVACIDMGMQPVLYVMWIEKSYLTQLFSNYHFGLIIHNAKVLLSEELKRTLCYILKL